MNEQFKKDFETLVQNEIAYISIMPDNHRKFLMDTLAIRDLDNWTIMSRVYDMFVSTVHRNESLKFEKRTILAIPSWDASKTYHYSIENKKRTITLSYESYIKDSFQVFWSDIIQERYDSDGPSKTVLAISLPFIVQQYQGQLRFGFLGDYFKYDS